ncbi:Beta-mannosidase B [Saitozyma sp. JCM 24511]|nr:Beta-mannosidase B [Saitozyma sp. JCM 24511]
MPSKTPIDSHWSFSQVSSPTWADVKEEWTTCASFPTSVHVELRKQGRIPDPFKGLNEWEVQWIQEADWTFKTTFEVTSYQLDEACADLIFEGLDTYCDISLNGKHLGSTDNMFLSHRLGCKDRLKRGDNELVLRFRSPWVEAKREEKENGGPMQLWNGDSCRLYSRKAQYGWGWDWGPVMMTVGPWRPISLETYSHRLENVRIDSDLLSPSYTTGTLTASFDVSPSLPSSGGHKVQAVLRDQAGKTVKEQTLVFGKDKLDWKLDDVEGWYPRNYGNQPLYQLELTLQDKSGKEVASCKNRVAFRHARVVQEPLQGQEGTSFLFEVNGVRVFCGGSNWIPADSFLTEIEPERYRRWVELLVRGNQNMLRVWGGGIYEDEVLYDTCDELGILVWQDFMFGCGLYPSYDKLNASIKVEAEQAVARLRNHPSVVIFAGNNEDYQVAEALGVMDYNDNSGEYMHTKFPARQIYEVILPEVVGRLSNIHYHRSSPYGGKDSRDPTVGDIHQWNVWHGTQEPWANWDKLAGRFVSEFGMQGYPDMRTVETWDDDKSQLFPQSRVSVNHNKADGFERRLELYLMENFRHAFDMESYVYYTQIMQAECLAAAYRLWRREWRGKGKEYTAGALVWQINDCWPCVSWAIADYFLRPKPAFFSIARELTPYTVGMARKDVKKPRDAVTSAFFEITQEIELWGCNSTVESKKAKVELVSFDLDEGEVDRRTLDVTLAPNSSTEIWKGAVPGQTVRTSSGQVPKPIVVQARLVDEDGRVLARYSNWPEPWKYLTFPDPKLRVEVNGDEVTLTCAKPIKGLVLDVEEGEEVEWSDQAVDLFPGDEQRIVAKGLAGRKVKARYIGDGSA